MNLFEKFVKFISGEMPTPQPYGWFHLMWCAIVICISIYLCVFQRKANDKKFRNIVLVSWLIMVSFEVYKQIVFSFHYDNETFFWDYSWYAFPFQFCSTPLYALPFIAFCKEGKFRDAMMAYISTFSLFAGISVMVYPTTVFVSTIGINIQTMLHHGTQVFLGIYLIAYNAKKLNIMYFLRGTLVFIGMVFIAMILNSVVPSFVPDDVFNMFFISFKFACELPILSTIQQLAPYPVFLLSYIAGFTLVAFIVYIIADLSCHKRNEKNKLKK